MSHSIQYTIRNVPPAVDAKLKAQAKQRGISLNTLLLEKKDFSESQPETIGRIVAPNDLWIAAVAVRLDVPLLTTDQGFARIDGVRLFL